MKKLFLFSCLSVPLLPIGSTLYGQTLHRPKGEDIAEIASQTLPYALEKDVFKQFLNYEPILVSRQAQNQTFILLDAFRGIPRLAVD